MARAVIFDVDGTLIDSVDLHAHAWQDAFCDFGRKFEIEALRDQIGKGGDQLLPVFLAPGEIADFGDALEKHRGRIMKDRYLDRVVAFSDVRELFQRLIQDGKQIGLASSASTKDLGAYMTIANVTDLLDVETSADDAEKSKPHPDIFQAALKKFDTMRPEDAIVIADTPYDAEAAGKAGLAMIGLSCGGWSEVDLLGAGCIAVYRDPTDLLARYERSPLA